MKFTCDSCGAQYMISDDKVGPNGVKVRCKKCQNVVLVRKATEPSPVAAAAHAGPSGANGAAEGGLDVELGLAFDSMLGGSPPAAVAPQEPEPEATQLMSREDAAKIGTASKTNGVSTPAASDWYVAIADSQVGPLPLSDVKRKWEAGEVGPDSLVWRPGMGDWAALSTVGELASALAPVPQPSRVRPAASERSSASRVSAAPLAPREEPTWKPAGASALAALASEEIASRGSEAKPAASAPRNTAKSLVEQMNLPDAGGVDPTGSIPLPIKGVEPSPSPQLKRRTSVARGAAEVRHRRSMLRGVVTGAVVAILLAGGVAGGLWYTGKLGGEPSAPVASATPAPAAAAPAAPALAAAAPVPRPVQHPVAAAPAPQPAAPAPAAAAPPEQKVEPERKVEPPPAPKPGPERIARADPAPRSARSERTERRVPRSEPVRQTTAEQPRAPEPEPPAPAPAASRKKDSILDFDGSSGSGGSSGSDHALEEALGGTPSGRSVYVPPRPGSDLPDHLTASQINESVLTQVDSLRRCVSEQKARDADASGTLRMRWMIQADGGVRDVKCLTPEYASGPFAQCISGVVKTIRFPRSTTKGQEVTFPFTF